MANNKDQTYEIEVDGLTVEITRKDILHLHVYISPPFGALTASVPEDVDDETVKAFISERKPWIEKQIAEFDKRAWTSKRQFVSGETIWIFGRQCFLKVEPADKMSFSYVGNEAILRTPSSSTVAEREAFVYSVLRAELNKRIDGLLPSVMEATGVDVHDVIVRKWDSRWSSCTREIGNININALLVHHAPAALRLVLVYECLHLKYNPSSKIFEKKLEELEPDWKKVLEKMNSIPIPRE